MPPFPPPSPLRRSRAMHPATLGPALGGAAGRRTFRFRRALSYRDGAFSGWRRVAVSPGGEKHPPCRGSRPGDDARETAPPDVSTRRAISGVGVGVAILLLRHDSPVARLHNALTIRRYALGDMVVDASHVSGLFFRQWPPVARSRDNSGAAKDRSLSLTRSPVVLVATRVVEPGVSRQTYRY